MLSSYKLPIIDFSGVEKVPRRFYQSFFEWIDLFVTPNDLLTDSLGIDSYNIADKIRFININKGIKSEIEQYCIELYKKKEHRQKYM